MSNRSVVQNTEYWQDFVEFTLKADSFSSQVIFSVSMLIIFLFSLIGNILTCVVVYYDRSMHTATNFYLFNLAVSDLLVTFPILLVIYQFLGHETHPISIRNETISYKFFHCIDYIFVTVLMNNGILVMIALSIERYIAIYHPMMLTGTPVWKRVGKILAVIWVIAIVEAIPVMWTVELIKTKKSIICFISQTQTAIIINRWLALMTFVIPLMIIMFVYTMIAFKVNFNRRNNFKDAVFNYPDRKKRVNKLIVQLTPLKFRCSAALTMSFVMCWLPWFLIRVVPYSAVAHVPQIHRWWSIANKVAIFNCWFSTVLNPLLFSIMSTKFRKACKKLWHKKCRKHTPVSDYTLTKGFQLGTFNGGVLKL